MGFYWKKKRWKKWGSKKSYYEAVTPQCPPLPPLCDTLLENSRQQVNWDFTTEFTSKCTWSIVVKNSFKCFVSTTFNFNVKQAYVINLTVTLFKLCNQFDCNLKACSGIYQSWGSCDFHETIIVKLRSLTGALSSVYQDCVL